MHLRLLFLAGLASLPLVGSAQTTPSSSPFYVGLGASALTSLPFQRSYGPTIYGPAFTAGAQLSPRWALQLGAGLGWQHEEYFNSYGAPNTTYASSYKNRFLTLPLLARYTFTAPTARFRFDALAGFTLVHTAAHNTYTVSYANGQVADVNDFDTSDNTYSFSLGPAVRYALTPRVELTANAVVNTVLNGGYYGTFSDRLYLNALVGAHYTFGLN